MDCKLKEPNLPDLSNYPSMFNNPTYYTKCYNTFMKYSNQRENTIQWIRDEFKSTVSEKLPELSALSSTGLRVLGIGSGNGNCEFEILLQLLERYPVIEITVVEPSKERINDYKVLVKQRAAELQGTTWIWKEERIEDFMQNDHGHFELITILHVLYFVQVSQLKEHLSSVYQLLNKDGLITIVHVKDEPRQSIEKGFFPNPPPSRPLTTERHIIDAFQNRSIPYQLEVLHIFPTTINITKCMTTINAISDEEYYLIDFITTVECARSLTPDKLRTVIEFLRQGCRRSGEEWFYDVSGSAMLVKKGGTL